MHCPYCRHTDSKVLDSRTTDDGASIRRRRQCPSCERRFTTVEQMQLVVVKRSGVVEPFNRDKVINGVKIGYRTPDRTPDALDSLSKIRSGPWVSPKYRPMKLVLQSLARSASWTRSPTSASQVSIASSGRWRISRPR